MCTKCRSSRHVPGDEQEQRRERRHRQVAERAARAATIAASTNDACTTAAIGERPPARMLVAVRAMAPVAAMPPKNGREEVADAVRHQLGVGVVLGAGHAVGDDRRQQRLDGAEHGDGEGARAASSRMQLEGEHQRLAVGAGEASTGSSGSGGRGGMPRPRLPPLHASRGTARRWWRPRSRRQLATARPRPARPRQRDERGRDLLGQPAARRCSSAERERADAEVLPGASRQLRPPARPPARVVVGELARRARAVLSSCSGGDHHRDARGEAGGDRVGDVLDEPPEASRPMETRKMPASTVDDQQAAEPVARWRWGRG